MKPIRPDHGRYVSFRETASSMGCLLVVVLSNNVKWHACCRRSNVIVGYTAIPLRTGHLYTFGVFLGSVASGYGREVNEVHNESIDEECHTEIEHEKRTSKWVKPGFTWTWSRYMLHGPSHYHERISVPRLWQPWRVAWRGVSSVGWMWPLLLTLMRQVTV